MDSTLLQMTREIARLENIIAGMQAGINDLCTKIGDAIGATFDDATPADAVVAAVRAKIDALTPKDEAKEPTPMKGQVRA